MADIPEDLMPPRDRYTGIGGAYVVVDGERFPADDQGRPLPHSRDENGSPIEPSAPAGGDEE